MALVSLETYYLFLSIDANNNNFKYSPENGTMWLDINVLEGSYELTDINDYIQRIMRENRHNNSIVIENYISIEPNNNTLKSVLDIAPRYKVDFMMANSTRTVLGFNS